MYFKDFPTFLYDFNYGNGKIKTSAVKDITRNIRFRRDILANITLYEEYDIVDGETPEIISEKFYGTPEYHWVVMLANERFDYNSEFPLMEPELDRHIKTAYNPKITADRWWYEGNTIYVDIMNSGVIFTEEYYTAQVVFTIKGMECDTNPPNGTYEWLNGDGTGIYNETTFFYQVPANKAPTGTPRGTVTITTEGRENNPVYWINEQGFKINHATPGAVGVTGAQHHRRENDKKRRIKLISPTLLATVLRNYKELL